MLRVASNALIVPPFECAWLSLGDYQLDGSCCLQFECKGIFQLKLEAGTAVVAGHGTRSKALLLLLLSCQPSQPA